MKSISRFLKGLVLTVLTAGAALSASAQSNLPICSGTGAGQIYYAISSGDIYRMDPNNPAGATFTNITLPLGVATNAKSLAVSRNLNGGTPSPTYYTTFLVGASRYVHYWNGTSWINTTHIMNVDQIAGGGGYLFGLDTGSGYVYRYDGTSTASLLVALGTSINISAPQDIAADCAGNFYVIITTGTGATMRKYTSTGALSTTYTLAGTFAAGGGGLAVNGNNVFYDGTDGKLYTGIISGTTVTFSGSAAMPFTGGNRVLDMGSCGYAGFNNNVGTRDSFKSCNGAQNVVLTATGPGPYNWTVVSGPAVITGSGQTVVVNSAAGSIITHTDANCAGSNQIVDTNILYVINAKVNAGPDKRIVGCGIYQDTLHATLSDTTAGILYAPFWSALGTSVYVGGTQVTLDPIVQITKTDTLILTVSTYGCDFKDSVIVTTVDSTPKANFQYLTRLGCEADTVQFFNTSTGGIDSVAWDFADSAGSTSIFFPNWHYSNAISPTYVFVHQGIYPVLLLVKNKYCFDTIRKNLVLLHPLKAKFGISDSTACASKIIVFSDSSVAPPPPPGKAKTTFFYRFGDGATSTLSSPTHQYTRSGVYTAVLTIQNYLGCRDSFKRTIIVDSLPFARIRSADTIVCQGQQINLKAEYLTVGSTGITYALGDGSVFQNTNDISYAFVEPGTYNVTLTAHYRYCPDVVFSYPFSVRPFPGINLGPDTVLCPYGAPVILSDRTNLGNTNARYVWSTGETTPAIAARNIGLYWARVNIGGCSATDSIMVNKDCYVDIPNSFTPNGDGSNDYFLPRQYMSRSVNNFRMTIYNRWGQEVFETTAIGGRGWDGKFNGVDQPLGVYVYVIDVSFDNGVNEHYTGNLTLLR